MRDAESIARRIAFDKVRKKEYLYAPEILEMERNLSNSLGTRVAIEPKENGGKLIIDFVGEDDLRILFAHLAARIAKLDEQPQLADESAPEPLDDRTKEEVEIDENAFDPSSFSL